MKRYIGDNFNYSFVEREDTVQAGLDSVSLATTRRFANRSTLEWCLFVVLTSGSRPLLRCKKEGGDGAQPQKPVQSVGFTPSTALEFSATQNILFSSGLILDCYHHAKAFASTPSADHHLLQELSP